MRSRLCLLGVGLLALSGCAITNPYYGELPGSGDMSQSGTTPDPNADMSFKACVSSEYKADQPPAAMMVVLDRSSSMIDNNKWATAAQAVVQALDQAPFDSMHLGLYASPSASTVNGPQCIFYTPVTCAAPPFPEVDLAVAGSLRSSDPSGVRRSIRDALNKLVPVGGMGDASPLYAALQSAGGFLKNWGQKGKRILLVVTDGGMSCTQLSSRAGFADCNGCTRDWEDPANLVGLLSGYQKDPAAPIETFLLGAPGADSYDARGCSFPPYRMRLALSAMAYAGAPSYVPPTCDGRTFVKTGADPAMSCHFDMTTGNFSAQSIASTIAQVRGKVIGCAYDLPTPRPGTVLNKDQINVKVQTSTETRDLLRRKDGSTTCTDCWDYNSEGRIELFGKSCDELKAGVGISVKVLAGCDTLVG